MTLLFIAFATYAVLSLPYAVEKARASVGTGKLVVACAGQIFAYVVLGLFLASHGLGIAVLAILFPTIAGIIAGIALGVSEVLDEHRTRDLLKR